MSNKDFNTLGWLQGLREASTKAKHALGALRVTNDGRKFRYAKAGGTALDPGKMGVCVLDTDNHVNLEVASNAAIGADQVTVTLGATAATNDQYKDGLLVVNDATGEGYSYGIDSNPAADASASLALTLKDSIQVALVAGTSQVTPYPNPWNGVALSTTEENKAAGVPLISVPASSYYWAQTGGLVSCWAGGTAGPANWLTLDGTTAGQLVTVSATIATTIAQPVVGYVMFGAQIDTEYKPVWLTLD